MKDGLPVKITSIKGSSIFREISPEDVKIKLGRADVSTLESDGKEFPQSMVLEGALMDIDPSEINEIEIG
jgi:hypothetical protein